MTFFLIRYHLRLLEVHNKEVNLIIELIIVNNYLHFSFTVLLNNDVK